MKRVLNIAKCDTGAGKLRMMGWSARWDFAMTDPLLSESAFIAGFDAIGEERYPHKHPFHLRMHEGALTRGQLQAWALNRYYYQSRIPIKDATILARSEDPAFRLVWRKRILDHDGDGVKPGGIEKWLRLVEATGLPREQALRGEGILPPTASPAPATCI